MELLFYVFTFCCIIEVSELKSTGETFNEYGKITERIRERRNVLNNRPVGKRRPNRTSKTFYKSMPKPLEITVHQNGVVVNSRLPTEIAKTNVISFPNNDYSKFERNKIDVIPGHTQIKINVIETANGRHISLQPEVQGHEIKVRPEPKSNREDTLPRPTSWEIESINGEDRKDYSTKSSDDPFQEGSGQFDLESFGNVETEVRTGRFIKLFADNKEQDIPCVTPKDEPGHCRHFRNCVLHEILNNFNMYLQYMCLRSTSVGICCPDNPVIEVVNDGNSTKADGKPTHPEDGCGMSVKNRIVGGEISQPREWTWMVALLKRNRFFCGGVLINSIYVLTAAHCTLGVNIRNLFVRLGEYNFNTKMEHQQDIPVASIKRHANFTTLTFQHDIALLKLQRHVEFSPDVKTICLPDEVEDFSGINATVVGWGTVSFGGAASPILRQVTIPIWDNSECDRTYVLEDINESFLCAGSSEEQDACQGDSGGPLMSLNVHGRWQVIGIVSWGRRCGDPNYPGVYTRVTTYLDWIQSHSE